MGVVVRKSEGGGPRQQPLALPSTKGGGLLARVLRSCVAGLASSVPCCWSCVLCCILTGVLGCGRGGACSWTSAPGRPDAPAPAPDRVATPRRATATHRRASRSGVPVRRPMFLVPRRASCVPRPGPVFHLTAKASRDLAPVVRGRCYSGTGLAEAKVVPLSSGTGLAIGKSRATLVFADPRRPQGRGHFDG